MAVILGIRLAVVQFCMVRGGQTCAPALFLLLSNWAIGCKSNFNFLTRISVSKSCKIWSFLINFKIWCLLSQCSLILCSPPPTFSYEKFQTYKKRWRKFIVKKHTHTHHWILYWKFCYFWFITCVSLCLFFIHQSILWIFFDASESKLHRYTSPLNTSAWVSPSSNFVCF